LTQVSPGASPTGPLYCEGQHLAAEGAGRPLASEALARARGLPEKFLLKALRPLVTAGLLLSDRGPRGGYRLARPAAKVTLLEVVEAVDGPLPAEAPAVAEDEAGKALDSRLREVCEHLTRLTRRRLGKVRLSDLAGRRLGKARFPGRAASAAGRRARLGRCRSVPRT
jgi:Rrf2 family protein